MGYSFRTRLEASEEGGVAVIQMKDLLDDNTVGCDHLAKINMENMKEHHLVQKGDLVFRSRGSLTTAAILTKNPGKAVVAAPLLVIRVTNPEKTLPEYLNWYISQQDAQIYFNSQGNVSAQKMISKESLENLEVNLPSLEIQKIIIELAKLSSIEQNLLRTLADKRKQYISTVLMQIANGE